MVYSVSWTAVCYVTVMTLFVKKVGVVRPNFGGSGPPDSPVVAPLPRSAEGEIDRTLLAPRAAENTVDTPQIGLDARLVRPICSVSTVFSVSGAQSKPECSNGSLEFSSTDDKLQVLNDATGDQVSTRNF